MNTTIPLSSGKGPGSEFGTRVRVIAKLAMPVTAARLGMLVLVMVDTAMTGHFSTAHLAYYSLAQAVSMVCMLVGVGMLIGTAVLCAQAVGAGAHKDCGVIWRVSVLHAFALGCFFALLAQAGTWFYHLLGYDTAFANGAGGVVAILNFGLPGQLIYTACILFLESLSRPGPGLVIMIAANVVNAGLNWLLIGGEMGLGAEGAAWATTAVRWLIALAAVIYILRMAEGGRYNVAGPMHQWRVIGGKLRGLGYPLGLAQGLESAAFASLTLFAGHISGQAAGAFQIVISMVGFCFMAAIGVGTATAVHVGMAIGRQDQRQMVLSGWAGLFTITVFMAVMAVIMALIPETLGHIFTDDPDLLAIVVPTLLVGAAILISDGAQGVLMGALRGAGDVWIPTAMHLCSFLLVMVPAAGWFALRTDLGTPGLMLGTFCGVTLAAILLAGRFHVLTKRPINRL
ncbi:MAG: MATE family efflux transporter [Rhodospirillaceae bacterium]|nr:MATE family efflux transporter [Rhodospirillaceae bacterium]MBT4487795.1 MATE family efflux transporter [Rhodospirillaceae bacterium]MBT5195629.1 MATE family efflux transporter [Rhodospirillaceae bacterium]MBT5894255.1 MATE family efflux transporter [Rhodospirillaceae bacterium]MBT6428936.1 MATE family efflux transporter [Rhodospirillaceae bacterium]